MTNTVVVSSVIEKTELENLDIPLQQFPNSDNIKNVEGDQSVEIF